MTAIPAEVVAAHRLVNQYHDRSHWSWTLWRLILVFGDNKPLIGACRDRRVDLIYLQDPGFCAGQRFPLWSIQ
jgi:hypothetical protein